VFTIGRSNGGHEFHGFRYVAANEVPSWGLGYERKDEDDVEEGGDGGGYVEIAPCLEDVGDAGEKCNAAGEEVEGGHTRCTALRWANWFGSKNKGGEADATAAEAGEEAEEDVDPVVRGQSC